MQYSLLSRFRGTLLGSFAGEILVSGGIGQVLDKATLTPAKPRDAQPCQSLSDWSRIADFGTESLIRRGRLDLEDWVLYCGMTQPSLLLLKSAASSGEAVVATLPIALYFHDDAVKLRQQLLQAAAIWLRETEVSEGVLAVAFAIALALTEKLDTTTLVPRTLAYLENSQTPLVQQLEQVQALLDKEVGLDAALSQLRRSRRGQSPGCSATSIALAFYCFLSTPEDFRLSVLRAARIGYQPQLAATLTGALSGAYNSIIGIPVGWRLVAHRMNSGVQKLKLADDLLAVWSGVYDVSAPQLSQHLAVAAPQVIQSR